MFDGNFRNGVDSVVRPVGRVLVRLGVSANLLTCIGLIMSVAACVLVGKGQLQLGLAFLILTAVPDLLDGAVAVAAGTSSKRGAFFDSTADRVTDGLLLCGIAWHLAESEGGTIMLLPMALLGVSSLISYERAKAELLGYDAKGGLMERAERMVVLGFGLCFEALLVPVLWFMLVLTAFTAAQRFVKVWRQATVDISSSNSKS
ncbi:MAG: CDP-alcohol phosphatidyltransferase family protein [Acidimicrobiales bacterium]|nr:CDP-alcohol phosphatidyltransferase family protein [Acidimicrobiales bacterium]RPH17984.1 MAG: CDP-alcohol phosphatidyltransferase family protein [Actinobacteria bacterium TMED270]|tara:strand:+ start:1514 stop:2122 length:609 start_codon:yes stop_codon:yes gene_type:complete